MNHSIIIPTYNNSFLVENCVQSIRKFEKDTQIIVVSDGSERKELGLLDRLSTNLGFELVIRPCNGGFAAAVNAGLTQAKGDVVTLVNNDVVFTRPLLQTITNTFEVDPKIGIIGARLFYPDGRIQHGGLYFSRSTLSFLDRFKNKKPESPVENRYLLAVTGALFSIKKELIDKIGLLNEKYFIACEDTEYCLRAWEAGYRVFLNRFVEALHKEGATRGNSPQTKKQKSPAWHLKEFEAIKLFRNDLEKFDISSFEKKIRALNGEPDKLEIGSGYNPHDGYIHLDVRGDLPKVNYVCNIERETLPFGDNSFKEVLANHVIEHISWRKLPFVLGEWLRVLEPGGKLVLRTPDLKFICETYLLEQTTPEYPPDEKFIKENLSSEITPAWWANLKLFSGQDYEANFHRVCFDFDMLHRVLRRVGFSDAFRVQLDREFSPGELQVETFKGQWSYKIVEDEKIDTPIKGRVLVKRKGALGDVLLTTPIVKRLHEEGWDVDVATDCVEVFEGNPHVNHVRGHIACQGSSCYDKVIDLNLAYEKTPNMHIIDAYSMVAFGDKKTPHKLDVHFDLRLGKKWRVTLHKGISWENRTWPEANWDTVFHTLGLNLVLPIRTIDSNITLSLHEIAQIIYETEVFVGSDSGLLHLAQALGVPSIGLYTCAKAEYRATGAFPIIPDIDCYGCLHDEPPPVTYCGCRRGDLACLDLITPEMVIEKVGEVLGG